MAISYEDARRIAVATARANHKAQRDWEGAVHDYIGMMCDLGHPTNNYEEGLAGAQDGGESSTRRMLRTGR